MPALKKLISITVSYLVASNPTSHNHNDEGYTSAELGVPEASKIDFSPGEPNVNTPAMNIELPVVGDFEASGTPFEPIVGALIDNEPHSTHIESSHRPIMPGHGDISTNGFVTINKRTLDAASKNCESVDVVTVGRDRILYHNYWTEQSGIHKWKSLRAITERAPVIISDQPGNLDVFFVGANKGVYVRHQDEDDYWSNWIGLSGPILSNVRAASAGPNNTVVCGLGGAKGESALCKHRINGVWSSDWLDLGAPLYSEPEVVTVSPNSFNIYAVGAGNEVWYKEYRDGKWTAGYWKGLGGVNINSPITAISWGSSLGRNDLFGIDTKGTPWHKYWDSKWVGFNNVGGIVRSAFSAAATSYFGVRRFDIVTLGSNTNVFHKSYDVPSNTWRGWANLGGDFDSAPLITSPGSDRLHIFAVGKDNALKHKLYNGQAWIPSQADWEGFGGNWTTFA